MTYNTWWRDQEHYEEWAHCWMNLQVGDTLIYDYPPQQYKVLSIDSHRIPITVDMRFLSNPDWYMSFPWPASKFAPPDRIIKAHAPKQEVQEEKEVLS